MHLLANDHLENKLFHDLKNPETPCNVERVQLTFKI